MHKQTLPAVLLKHCSFKWWLMISSPNQKPQPIQYLITYSNPKQAYILKIGNDM